MKILLSNKFYYYRGGDCIYTINLERLLLKNGHEVAIFAMQYPENIDTSYNKYFPSEISFTISGNRNIIESFIRPLGTKEVRNKFSQLIHDFKPDIVHLNNIHTQLSPIIAEIAEANKIPVIWTLHDYKLLCPRYDCLRNDKTVCELCFDNKTNVIKYRCMKNNLAASLIAYFEVKKWNKNKLESKIKSYICPSQFIKTKMEEGGFNKQKLVHLSNFINLDQFQEKAYEKEDYYCYIGRLSHEKGINTLLEAASQLPFSLKVIGGGPLLDSCKKIAPENTTFLGYRNWTDIKDLIGKARFIVTPSEWYENNPLSIIEALCLGTPVIGANIGGIPELITENENGLLFESGNVTELKDTIEKAWQLFNKKFNYDHILKKAQTKFSDEKYYNELMKIYQQNISI